MKLFINSTTYKNIKDELVHFLTTDVYYAYAYACYIIKRPWASVGRPDVDDMLKQSEYSMRYRRYFK